MDPYRRDHPGLSKGIPSSILGYLVFWNPMNLYCRDHLGLSRDIPSIRKYLLFCDHMELYCIPSWDILSIYPGILSISGLYRPVLIGPSWDINIPSIPLKSNNQNTFFLNIIDDYRRFPFLIPCQDVGARSVMECLCQLLSFCGMPAYIHPDRGSSFMGEEFRHFLLSKCIATSRTTPYNPACTEMVKWIGIMGLCERL